MRSGLPTCFVTLSSSSPFRGLRYQDTIEEIGALAREFSGWSRADLFGLSVRERRYWIKWATWMAAQAKPAPGGR